MSRRIAVRREASIGKDELVLKAPAVLFDLDGTLMDSNYEHVAAWRLAFRSDGIEVRNAFLHRCIGMRGTLLISAVLKEIGRAHIEQSGRKLEKLHKAYI